MNDQYKLHLTEEQIRQLDQGEDDIGFFQIENLTDGHIIESNDLDLVDILMGKNRKVA